NTSTSETDRKAEPPAFAGGRRLCIWKVAGGLGFEPRFSESESDVLPLDDPPNVGARRRNGRRASRRRNRRLASSLARLALRVLRRAAGLAQAHLLALDLARVARRETGLAQGLAQRLVVGHERARDAVADCAGLAGRAAAADRDVNVELVLGLGDGERLTHDHARGLAAEEDVERAAVDDDLAAARTQKDTCRRGLAAAGAVVTGRCHLLRSPTGSAAARRADARCRGRP